MKVFSYCLIALSAGALFILGACSKNYSPEPAPTYEQSFGELRTKPNTFYIAAGTYQTAIGSKGTVLRFYPNSFKDKAGKIIVGDTIKVELTEMYGAGDMLANNTTALCNGIPLKSCGQITVSATLKNEVVFANKYGVNFKASATASGPMELYSGYKNNQDDATEWKMIDTNLVGTTAPNPVDSQYVFDSVPVFNTVNGDRRISMPGGSTGIVSNMQVVMDRTDVKSGNCTVFYTYAGTGIKMLYNTAFNTFNCPNVVCQPPVGSKVNIIAIMNKNPTSATGDYIMGQLNNVTVTAEMKVKLQMNPASLVQVNNALKQL